MKLSTWSCLKIGMRDKVAEQRLVIVPLKKWNSSHTWEQPYLLNYLHTYLITSLLIYFMEQSPWEADQFSASQEIPDPKGSLPHSQMPATCTCPKPHWSSLCLLHSSTNIIQVIKLRRIRWGGHVAHMGERRGIYRVLVGKPEGKRPFGRPKHRWEGGYC